MTSQTTTSTTSQTVLVPHFAREIRSDRRRRPLEIDQAAVVTSHFLRAAARSSVRSEAVDSRVHRVPAGGGYRVIRKRLAD